ncbi:hypothetical protein [Desulforamulus putei]|uniref:Uncharacterized protein n=1 Tax=Desulforamulus putei DSM 12395 TaxID=1121429 RepID=A0A1M4S9E7_9FIRM|nr:hypothetical protein [Desulforamulus putei]SHE28775.1 hypothetical protein SAMN02745133_00023 [Desulforamulus putei DSM 12395]
MGKIKIRKNLSDEEMLANYKEEITFENAWDDAAVTRPAPKPVKKDSEKEGIHSFFTPELQEQVGKALLELKIQLYKEGIIDYRIEVSREGRQVILTAVNAVGKKKTAEKTTGKKK